MYRGLPFRSSTAVLAFSSSSSTSATKQNLLLTSSIHETKSTIFSAPTQRLFAFESRSGGPKPVVRAATNVNRASSNSTTTTSTTTSNSSSISQENNNQQQQNTKASFKYPQLMKEWKRILVASEKSPSNQLRDELIHSLQNSPDVANLLLEITSSASSSSSSSVFDSPFVQTLLNVTAAVLPLPYVNSAPSAYSKQRDATSLSSSSSSSLPQLVSHAIDWIVARRQQPQAYDDGSLSLDAAVAHYCLVRLGIFQNNNKSSETAKRLALNQRELRNLTIGALSTIIYTCSFIGKSALPAGEACALKLTPLLQQQQVQQALTLQQINTIAAFVFDPANESSSTERMTVALRKAISAKLASAEFTNKTNLEQVAGAQSAVVVSLISSILRDPTCVTANSASQVILHQLCQLFLEENSESMTASPRSVLEIVRAYSEFLVARASLMGSSSSNNNNNDANHHQQQDMNMNMMIHNSIAKFCGKLNRDQLKQDVFCATELYQYLTLSVFATTASSNSNNTAFASVSEIVISFIEQEFIQECLKNLSSASSSDEEVAKIWIYADSLLSGLSRRSKENQQQLLQQQLSEAYLNNLNQSVSSSSTNNQNNNSNNNTQFAKRISALLKTPNMIQRPEVQRIITNIGSKHSAPLSDILIILEGLTASPFTQNSHEARQMARSIAPTQQLLSLMGNTSTGTSSSSSSSSATTTSTDSTTTPAPIPVTTTANVTTSNSFTAALSPKEELVRLAHSYGALRVREESLCQALISRALQLRDELSAEELGVFVFALARMDERNPKPYVDLAHRVRTVTATASASAATAIIVAYARAAAVWNYTMYFRLCERIVELKASWSRQDMLPLLIALLRLELRHEKILEIVTLEVMKSDASKMSTDDCVRFLSILTQFTPNTPVVTKLGEIFVQRQNELSSVELGDVLSSLGRAHAGISKILEGEKALLLASNNNKNSSNNNNEVIVKFEQELAAIRSLFEQLVYRTTIVAPAAPPIAIASILNGFSSLKYAHKEIFSVLGDRLLQIKKDCPALVIGQALSAFATVGLRDDKLFIEMIPRVRFVAHHGSPQDVANVLTAYTTVQLWHYKLFVRLAERAIAIRSDCRPQHIAQILNAFAKVQMKYDKLFIELSPRIQVIAGSASASEVATIVSSYAGMNLYDAPVFSQMADRAVQISSQFSGEDALKVMESFTKLSIQHEALKKALGKKAEDEKLKQENDEKEKKKKQSEMMESGISSRSGDLGEEGDESNEAENVGDDENGDDDDGEVLVVGRSTSSSSQISGLEEELANEEEVINSK